MKKYIERILQDTQAVLFDLDGTLVDSMWMWKNIDIEYLGRFGIPYQEGLQQQIEGMSFSETALYFKEHFQIPDSIQQMKDDWNAMALHKYTHEVFLKPGAERFLKELKKRGIQTGIATSNSKELVTAVMDSLGIHDKIDTVVTGCEVSHGKPSPDIYLEAAKRLGAQQSRCVVFEDIVPGIMAGKAAGMYVFAVEDPYSSQFWEQKKAQADDYIRDYRDFFIDPAAE
jgi:16S rRNA pseudouridine516 synthase